MRHSYSLNDVTFLLTDITGKIEALDIEEREKRIQSGESYGRMLPLEKEPSQEYKSLFEESVHKYKTDLAKSVLILSQRIYEKKSKDVVLVSLARGGTPIGILVKRCLKLFYNVNVPHYSISIIRGEGLDVNAMKFICQLHRSKDIQFVDGWVGKGAVGRTLEQHCNNLRKNPLWENLDSTLAVLSDPTQTTELAGSYEDFLIPSACLNATVSGLISRTVYNPEILKETDYHGAVFYDHLEDCDYSKYFVDTVTEELKTLTKLEVLPTPKKTHKTALQEVEEIAKHFNIEDINKVKPGVGETTRVLLRRVPWKVLVRDFKEKEGLEHIFKLCEEKGIEIEEYPLEHYITCGLIKKLADI